jgi:putative cell wall-binding protein
MVQAWRDAGIVPVFAAGNEYYLVNNPANYPESVAVGATDYADKRAPFSNTGPGAYAGAKMKPDVVAPGMYIRSAVPGGYDYFDGTSMAAPHVTGVVALLRSADPSLSVDEIVAILKETATPLVDEQFLGVPNYGYGSGLVNAFQAVAKVYQPEGLPVIQQPVHGQYVNEAVTLVKGEVPQDGLVTIYVNNRKAATVRSANKRFEAEVELEEGRNVLTATLTVDGVEGEPSVPVTVLFDAEPPLIQILDLEDDLLLTAGDHLTVSFMTESRLKRAELYLVERFRAVDPLPFEEVEPGYFQVKWTVPEGIALSFAEAIVVVEDEAGNQSETVAMGTVTVVADDNRMERLSGKDRYATAVEISQTGWREADTVVIARGDHYADALAGVPLAYLYNAPILLTRTNTLPGLVADEIERLGAARAILLGGRQAVSQQVADQLEKMGLEVERIAGENRYDTASRIARRVAPLGAEQAVVVNGNAFADALSIGAYAAQEQWPILLTAPRQLTAETKSALEALGTQQVTVIGGSQVISSQVVNDLSTMGIKVERIAGANRYETSVKVAEDVRDYFGHLYVTTGETYADALTGAVLAAKRKTGLILVEDDRVPAAVNTFVKKYPIMKMDILGGEQAVGPEVAEALSRRLVRY